MNRFFLTLRLAFKEDTISMKKSTFFIFFSLLSLAACGQDNPKMPDTPSQPSPSPTVAVKNTPLPTPEPTAKVNIPTPTAAPLVTDAPEEPLKLTAEIEYTPVTPVTSGELTRLALTDSAKGLLLDLDGDGREERLYCAKEGIYIDGILAASPWHTQTGADFQPWEQVWLVDVDSSDSYLNLIFQLGNGQEILAWYHDGIRWEAHENFSHDSFTRSAEYRGDGTLLIQSCLLPVLHESCWYRTVEFLWDTQNGMQLAEQTVILQEEEEIKNSEYVNGEPWQLISDIRLYADPHSEAESITAQSGQKVYQLKIHFSDYGRCWIFITTEHGEEGWFYAEYTDDATWTINQETDARDIINGFSSVN